MFAKTDLFNFRLLQNLGEGGDFMVEIREESLSQQPSNPSTEHVEKGSNPSTHPLAVALKRPAITRVEIAVALYYKEPVMDLFLSSGVGWTLENRSLINPPGAT